jgi:hypothetical protein
LRHAPHARANPLVEAVKEAVEISIKVAHQRVVGTERPIPAQ